MRLFKTILLFAFLALAPLQAHAQGAGMSIIRDTEIEAALREWSSPLWRAAGLSPDAVKLVIVQSDELNAFVAGGSNIFVYTGLIEATKSPGELLGVIAHETGHIAGGHLIQGRMAAERASYEAILATVLGIGAAASGAGDAANALILGGRGMAMGGYLAHSRVQESSADQAALRFMEASQYNPGGLARFLGTLKNQELVPQSQQTAYYRSHPLTADRLSAMEEGVRKSKYAATAYPPAMVTEFERIKAKLQAFINPRRIDWVYSEKDTSVPAQYARAIAAYKRSDKTKALNLIDALVSKEPKNPWFHELKGQMLRDFGDLPSAITSYRKAVALAPEAALIRIDLAQVLIEMPGGNTQANMAEAEQNLDQAIQTEKKSSEIHRLYATMFGRTGREPQAQYHLAEIAAMRGNNKEAQKLLALALPGLKPGTRDFRLANDLKLYLDAQPKTDDKRKN